MCSKRPYPGIHFAVPQSDE
eukprot:gene27673-36485_t